MIPDSPDPVVLRTAYAWDCPSCGQRDIFGANVEAELTDDEKVELRKIMGDYEGEQWKGKHFKEEVGLVTNPHEVTCPKCGGVFPVFCEPDAQMPPGFDPHEELKP